MYWRSIFCITGLCLLSACSQLNSSSGAYSTIWQAFFKPNSSLPSAKKLQNIPYDVLWVSFANGRPGGMILVDNFNGKERWVSANYQMLTLWQGRIINTTHLPSNVSGFRSNMIDPLPNMLKREKADFIYEMDFYEKHLSQVEFHSVLTNQGAVKHDIGGNEYETIYVTEVVEGSHFNFKAKNEYWLAAESGAVLKSRQCFIAGIGCITVEYIKRVL